MYEPHPRTPRGEGRVWGSSNPPHSCQPPPERGVDDGDGDDGLRQATLISSMIISSNTTKAISEASPKTKFMPARSKTTCVMLPEANFFEKTGPFKKSISVCFVQGVERCVGRREVCFAHGG